VLKGIVYIDITNFPSVVGIIVDYVKTLYQLKRLFCFECEGCLVCMVRHGEAVMVRNGAVVTSPRVLWWNSLGKT
jgi:hypothetical protein